MTEETLQEKVEDLEYQISKIDGKTLGCNIGNRIYGLLGLTLAAFGTYAAHKIGNNAVEIGSACLMIPFSVEMLGDVVTGKHHFISYRLFKAHPKYELERLQRQQESNLVNI